MFSRTAISLSMLLSCAAAPLRADSPLPVEYKIIKRDRATQTTRDVNGKATLFLTVKFTVEQVGSGRPVADIKNDEIVITEDGRPVANLEIFRPRSIEPLSVVLITDTSGSMKDPADDGEKVSKIDALRQAGAEFVKNLPNGAKLTLLSFSTTVNRPDSFTDRKDEVARRVELLRADGETALFDAVLTGLQTLEAARLPGRQAIVVLTDGIDNSSRHRVEEVIERAQEAKVPLYTIGFGRDGDFDKTVMDDKMAQKTGGKFFHARNAKDLQLHFRQLSEEFQPDYTVTFPSLRQSHDGTARNIEIAIVRAGKTVSGRESFDYQVHGVVVPKMDQAIYLGLLLVIGVLLAAPSGVRRMYRFYGGG